MVNRRFGLGTWEDILLERQHRIEEHNKELKAERIKKNKITKQWYKALEILGSVIFVISFCAITFYVIVSNMKK